MLDKPSPEPHLNPKIVLSMISVEYCWPASDVKFLILAYEFFFVGYKLPVRETGHCLSNLRVLLFYKTGTLISLSLKLHNTSL